MEIVVYRTIDSVIAKYASVKGNSLIDVAVKRILTTVNHAFSLRFLNLNCQICENFT